ncbi:PREDICTED: basic helix-loop-helix protein A-like isoform X2 [Nelumbo nucifera]|uniref:Basic helix-loop-helix protein A-like isoform X2 n=1 Tax=Nelumbo nucifera TaxID=4432 RepID=A0A1U8BDU7_NELNU|nr:PREDICTED: basic helix-loop-helix protein A-like isoform X2 [Nelumbo nucifera]
MAAPVSNRLQQMLKSAVQSVQWTYSLFWRICPQQGILVWGDGYYNGQIKTRKTVQPMEVSAEEASLQRSQQLRELYESLSGSETNQPARRPSAALSPEDLTETEWFYLMCVSFSFAPGVELPGKAFARRHHVWLSGANEVDSKVFSRSILAKTVICIPLMDGVVEFGTTERVQEDLRLVQQVKSFFVEHHNPPKPALSEHSTSNPATSVDRPQFDSSPPLPAVYTIADPPANVNENDEEEEEDEEDEEEDEVESDSEAQTGRGSHPNAAQHPRRICPPINQGGTPAQAAAEPSELMQLEMSEDIRMGSPDDGSNNLESDVHILGASQSGGQEDHQRRGDSYRAESARRWPQSKQDQLGNGLQPPPLAPQMDESAQEDSHYSQTVSTIIQRNSSRWLESSSVGPVGYSAHSAFSKWNCRNDHLLHLRLEGTSQWLLKYILFTVPFLHNKYRDENSPKSRDGDSAARFRKGTPQDELSANHVLAERRRREKLNERFIILRSLVPFVTKMDKASILGDTIEYVKQLRKKIQDLESRNRQMESDQRPRNEDTQKTSSSKEQWSVHGNSGITLPERSRGFAGSDKRKLRIVEGAGGRRPSRMVGNTVEVSIIESDALLELQCPYRDGLLIDIMQMLRELRFEITAVHSSSTNGIFNAELRAKVKENVNEKKPSIAEVKRAIHQIINEF